MLPEILAKVAEATEVRHEDTFGVDINLRTAGITDVFDQAATAATVGAVNAKRNKTVMRGDILTVTFRTTGLSAQQAIKEAMDMFTSIRNILAHKVEMIKKAAAEKAAAEV